MAVVARASILIGALALSACGQMDIASRNAPFEALPAAPVRAPAGFEQVSMQAFTTPEAIAPEERLDYRIGKVSFRAPADLTVSEANLYYPVADIVWRGDLPGDRKAQVGAIFSEAVDRIRRDMAGSRTVDLDVTLIRFHSVSEKARYQVGGVHNIKFDLIVRDAETGRAIGGIGRTIKADLKAFGGRHAIEADRQGLTMKERIIRHLEMVLTAELTHPGGFIAAQPKLERAMDQI